MSTQTDYARRLFPEQMTARRYAREEATLAAESTPQVYAPSLYYSAPAPYKDALEYAFWKAQFAAAVREKAEPLRYTLHDHNLERVQENVRAFLAGVDALLAPLTAQKAFEELPSAPERVLPSEIAEAEQQALEDWKAARCNACNHQAIEEAHAQTDALIRLAPYWLSALCNWGAACLDRVFAAMDRRLPLWMGAVVIVAVPYFLFHFVRAFGVREGWW